MSLLKMVAVGAVIGILAGCAFSPADPKTYNGQYMQMLTSNGRFLTQWNVVDEAKCASNVKVISTLDIFGRNNVFCTKVSNPNTTHTSTVRTEKGDELIMEFIGLDDCNKYTADGAKDGMKVVEFCHEK